VRKILGKAAKGSVAGGGFTATGASTEGGAGAGASTGGGAGAGASVMGASLGAVAGRVQPLRRHRSTTTFIQAVEDIVRPLYFISSSLIQPRLL
jgi:hypothetical protein